jgi:hypothetical protein
MFIVRPGRRTAAEDLTAAAVRSSAGLDRELAGRALLTGEVSSSQRDRLSCTLGTGWPPGGFRLEAGASSVPLPRNAMATCYPKAQSHARA